jgi:uncharacterized membrane protein
VSDRALRLATAALALAGAGAAGYLVWVRETGATLVCATGGCGTVQNSEYAEVAGFSNYLLYVQVALIGEVCDWCLVSDALVT